MATKRGQKRARKDASTSSEQPKKSTKKDSEAAIASLSTQETCDLIAEISESVLEDPNAAFEKKDGIRKLLSLASIQNNKNEYTARLAIMSLLAIFKDILPSYRIRLPTAADLAVRLKKETKKLWDYERMLLKSYQQYLQAIEVAWKQTTFPGLRATAMLSACELFKSAFHFNFRSNLMTLVVRNMHLREDVGDACCEAMEYVFANDAQGDVALDAARMVAKMIKNRNFRIRARVLRTFVAIPLRVHVDEAEAAKIAMAANAKKRKKDRQVAEIENELKEGSGKVDKILLARHQSDTLQAVILTYFRILKSEDLNVAHIEELLPPALEGLAKFAHLINIDTVVDLLAVLKTLLQKVDALPVDAALNCVLTAFQTLQGPGKEMKIDHKEYVTPLYSQLPRVCSDSNSMKYTDVLLDCLDAALIKHREYSTARIAAFFKQLSTTALHTPPHTAVPLLAFARQLTQRYPCVQQLLENEQDVITSGQYTPDVEDPEHTNPFATAAWELATLKFHVHPSVAEQAEAAASQKMLKMPAETPGRLRSELIKDSNEAYIKASRSTKRHPLEPKAKDKRRKLYRFITPRKSEVDMELLSME